MYVQEKDLEAKLQEEIAKRTTANSGDAFLLSESDSIVSQITSEAARAHMEVLEAEIAMLPESKFQFEYLEPFNFLFFFVSIN